MKRLIAILASLMVLITSFPISAEEKQETPVFTKDLLLFQGSILSALLDERLSQAVQSAESLKRSGVGTRIAFSVDENRAVAEMNGAAAKAGLKDGDTIITVNGVETKSAEDVISAFNGLLTDDEKKIGEVVTLTVEREGKRVEVKDRMELLWRARPEDADRILEWIKGLQKTAGEVIASIQKIVDGMKDDEKIPLTDSRLVQFQTNLEILALLIEGVEQELNTAFEKATQDTK